MLRFAKRDIPAQQIVGKTMRRKRILLAEDQVEVRKIIGLVLAEEEFELLEASDGLQALQMAREHKPDLLLLDIGIPNLNGIEVCRCLRADSSTSNVKIVALTAQASPTDREAALEAGMNGFLTKPFGPAKLLNTIRQMVGNELP